MCVLGAGLDTRPWRISSDIRFSLPQLRNQTINYFELDQPSLFKYKLPLLSQVHAISKFDYHSIATDLQKNEWIDQIQSVGFCPNTPTLWILEGFAGCLSKEKLDQLFDGLNALTCSKSRIIVTFLSSKLENTHASTTEDIFHPEDPLQYIQSKGWRAKRSLTILDLAQHYDRPLHGDPEHLKEYYIIDAKYP